MPVPTFCMQSNSDGTPVPTRHQAENYCCKYCSKHSKRKGHSSVLYELLDDMVGKDASAKEKFGDDFEHSKLGARLHRAFTAEIGEEMCQAEVAHHANKCPEYLCARPQKYVHLYKKALAISTRSKKKKAAEDDGWADGGDGDDWGEAPVTMQGSDVDLYEKRLQHWFPEGTPISPHLPAKETPEEQVAAANAWDFFRFVRFRGGRNAYFEWHPEGSMPIVIMSPVVKLAEGADFAFGARWALMQYHPWEDRGHFMNMSDQEVKHYFRALSLIHI